MNRTPEKQREYYLKNREKILARAKKWYQDNKDRKLKYDKQYNHLPDVRKRKNKQSVEWVVRNKERRLEITKKSYHANKSAKFAYYNLCGALIIYAKEIKLQRKPIAVLVSDIHFTVPTLELAGKSLETALLKAQQLNVPTIVCGDTLDSKSIIRAECLHRLSLALARCARTKTYFLVGNHDLWNEKGSENSLFIGHHNNVTIVTSTLTIPLDSSLNGLRARLVAYQSDPKKFKELLNPPGWDFYKNPDIVICHQGFLGAYMGHYIQDKTSVDPTEFKGRRIISGHYHKRQDLPGTNISYLGNPYTLGFGEAHDGPKGFNILYSDGSLELVPLDLPKHIIAERTAHTLMDPIENLNEGDHLLLKVTDTEEELSYINKYETGMGHLGHANFRLDLIPTTVEQETGEVAVELTEGELLDKLIESLDGTEDYKADLKNTWRGLL